MAHSYFIYYLFSFIVLKFWCIIEIQLFLFQVWFQKQQHFMYLNLVRGVILQCTRVNTKGVKSVLKVLSSEHGVVAFWFKECIKSF